MKKEVEDEPTSPGARLMQTQKFNLCIISVKGYATAINADTFKVAVRRTLLNHPRFTSILVTGSGKNRWKQTTVDLENHVFEVDLGPDIECPDEFVEDYASRLSAIPMDTSRPLWEMHILNLKTSDANATVLMKIHHSMGDGVSLMCLLHACSRRISDPDSLPSFPATAKLNRSSHKVGFLASIWKVLMVCFYTFIDCWLLLASLFFLKDTPTPLTVASDGAEPPRTRFVHRVVSLEDVRLVKTVMNMTINDVLLGVTEAGLSRYLRSRYANSSLPRRLSLTSAVIFNLRKAPTIEELVEMMEKKKLNGMWGNIVGIVLLPFTIEVEQDPLAYIRRAKATMDRKKLSLASNFTFFVMKLVMSVLGMEAAGSMTRALFRSTTFTFSNVVGPNEEVFLFGHHLSYIAPSVHGVPQSLVVHYQSYGGKLIISISADEKVVHNPHLLCDDLVLSLHTIKDAVVKTHLP